MKDCAKVPAVGLLFCFAWAVGPAPLAAQDTTCEDDEDCQAEEYCDLRAARCAPVPEDWCEEHEECDGYCDKPAARFGLCEVSWIACESSGECEAGLECRSTLRRGGDVGQSCQPPLTACDGGAPCPDRFECIESGPLAGTCFPRLHECEVHADCGSGWACVKFDDDGDRDELLAPPTWGTDDQSVHACVPVAWAVSSWRAPADGDEEEEQEEEGQEEEGQEEEEQEEEHGAAQHPGEAEPASGPGAQMATSGEQDAPTSAAASKMGLPGAADEAEQEAPQPTSDSGGCAVGGEHGGSIGAPVLVALMLLLLRARRRRRSVVPGGW